MGLPVLPLEGKRSAQDPREPKALGIKAGWPRHGTRRGARPASPAALRRDAKGSGVSNRPRSDSGELESRSDGQASGSKAGEGPNTAYLP